MARTLLVYDDIFLDHETGSHPERKERLNYIIKRLRQANLSLQEIQPRKAQDNEIQLIHTEEYINHVKQTIEKGQRFLDSMDTYISPGSLNAAYFAAGSGLEAADRIMRGDADNAFCAVRPPGHHAEKDKSMGFCIFNNVAIAARYLQEKYNLDKILILDWDVHHGNATEHSFYDNPSIYYISLHQYPHYPGTGHQNDIGLGKGKGYTKNYPMTAGSDDSDYLPRMQEIKKIIKEYAPEFILLSTGFDAHEQDPLSDIHLTSHVFADFTELVLQSTDSTQGRIISFLEGGYHLEALAESTWHHVRMLKNA